MKQKKSLKELTLLDRFLFDEVVEDKESMELILEIILGREVLLKCLPQSEKETRKSPLYRHIRLDVWAQDVEEAVYNNEELSSEIVSDKIKALKKRVESIKSSEEVSVKYMQAWEEHIYDRREGRAEGKSSEIRIIRRKLEKGMHSEEIADLLEVEQEYIAKIEKLICDYSEETDFQIAERYFDAERWRPEA